MKCALAYNFMVGHDDSPRATGSFLFELNMRAALAHYLVANPLESFG